MKKFIIQLILFSTILTAIFILLFFTTKKVVEAKTNYKIPGNITKVVIGHSHPECAYNDSLINNLKNISSSGSSYFYNYYTLMPLINNNKNIKTVFIEFTNNQIDTAMSEWIWGDKYLPFKYQVLGAYIDPVELSLFLNKNPHGLINGYIKLLRQNIKLIATSNYDYTHERGGYRYLVEEKIEAAIKKQNKNSNDTNHKAISVYNLSYLEKIISFCNAKNIQVYLIRSPLHKKYIGYSNEILFQNMLATRFKSTEFLDFKNYPLPDSSFGDLEHLNYRGARLFSIYFNELIEKGLLLEPNKQLFIDKNINGETAPMLNIAKMGTL